MVHICLRCPHLSKSSGSPLRSPPQVLDQLGFAPKDAFPVYADRMPNQLLAYLRLARLQDPALFAKVRGQQLGTGSGVAVQPGCLRAAV